jgi:hypothetical protein
MHNSHAVSNMLEWSICRSPHDTGHDFSRVDIVIPISKALEYQRSGIPHPGIPVSRNAMGFRGWKSGTLAFHVLTVMQSRSSARLCSRVMIERQTWSQRGCNV